MNSETGKWLIAAGILIVVAGVLIYFFHDKLQCLGKLPGDVSIQKSNFSLYFPFTTMLLCSGLLTLIINIIKKILQ